jgi:hypothetical protein
MKTQEWVHLFHGRIYSYTFSECDLCSFSYLICLDAHLFEVSVIPCFNTIRTAYSATSSRARHKQFLLELQQVFLTFIYTLMILNKVYVIVMYEILVMTVRLPGRLHCTDIKENLIYPITLSVDSNNKDGNKRRRNSSMTLIEYNKKGKIIS